MEERGSSLFRYILRVLCGADDLCGICLWDEYATARCAGGNEVCGSCLYPLAGSPYRCQPAGWRWRREIGLFFKRCHAAVCECEDLSFWDYGTDRICNELQYGSAGIGFL